MTNVVTRIAPSPTGDMHIGTARTALFNYLYAKHMGGKFMLRVEDTDKDRSTNEAVDVILNGLKWLGLPYDGFAVYQSQNESRHIKVAAEMVKNGSAYCCYMPASDAEAWKKAHPGKAFRSSWRDNGRSEMGDPYVVRLKVPLDGTTVVNDLVKGPITFENSNLDDIVLLRSDGTPTYNLAVVVDDHDMGITHVIRGDDHINNTPRQMLIYSAMGWDLPAFGHIPLIFTESGKKMSKRDGAASVMDYEAMGYLPESMRNYLARLGWGHSDSEIFTDAEAIEWFDIKDVVSSPARMNEKKLRFINHHYINAADVDRLAAMVDADPKVVALVREGAHTIPELKTLCGFAGARVEPDEKAAALLGTEEAKTVLRSLWGILGRVPSNDWTKDSLNERIRAFADTEGLKMGKIGPPVRAALTGVLTAPDLGTLLVIIGKSESLDRMEDDPFAEEFRADSALEITE
jgi:glutamyl-tRNA synthetase